MTQLDVLGDVGVLSNPTLNYGGSSAWSLGEPLKVGLGLERILQKLTASVINSFVSEEQLDLLRICKNAQLLHKRFDLPKGVAKGVSFASSFNDFVNVMRLRSQVYTPLGYNVQFPERIEGLNFDDYDSNALSLMIKHRKKLVGSFRIVLDSPIGIPSEKMYDFNSVRRKYRIAELSRLVVDEEHRSGSKEQGSKAFNELFSAAYRFGDKIGVDRYVMVMKAAHESRFLEFGGIEKIGETMYGNLDQDSSILLWDFNNVSEHFVDNVLNYKLREAA